MRNSFSSFSVFGGAVVNHPSFEKPTKPIRPQHTGKELEEKRQFTIRGLQHFRRLFIGQRDRREAP